MASRIPTKHSFCHILSIHLIAMGMRALPARITRLNESMKFPHHPVAQLAGFNGMYYRPHPFNQPPRRLMIPIRSSSLRNLQRWLKSICMSVLVPSSTLLSEDSQG